MTAKVSGFARIKSGPSSCFEMERGVYHLPIWPAGYRSNPSLARVSKRPGACASFTYDWPPSSNLIQRCDVSSHACNVDGQPTARHDPGCWVKLRIRPSASMTQPCASAVLLHWSSNVATPFASGTKHAMEYPTILPVCG